jgi:hypothetical protein
MEEKVHSPFHVVEEFISPANAERITAALGIAVPSLAEDGRPLKHERFIKDPELMNLLQNALGDNRQDIETRYAGELQGIQPPLFQQYFEDPKHPCELHGCESSKYLRKKWVKVKDIDLVGYIWLKDYGSGVPLDPRHEVYGGKLEFPAYNFSLVPTRGTLVIFPAGPHFITAISPVLVGSFEQIKFTLKLSTKNGGLWIYQPNQFPGGYQDWFAD